MKAVERPAENRRVRSLEIATIVCVATEWAVADRWPMALWALVPLGIVLGALALDRARGREGYVPLAAAVIANPVTVFFGLGTVLQLFMTLVFGGAFRH